MLDMLLKPPVREMPRYSRKVPVSTKRMLFDTLDAKQSR